MGYMHVSVMSYGLFCMAVCKKTQCHRDTVLPLKKFNSFSVAL